MNRNLVGSIYGMSSIKIAHFVVHLVKRFQRRRFKKIDQSELPVVAMFVNGSELNEQF
jgi:hypothetical protein